MKNWAKRLAPVATFIAVAAICVGPVAISDQGTPTHEGLAPASLPVATSSTTVLGPVLTPSNDIPFYPDYQAEREAALSYLRSPERMERFQSDFAKASVLVASGLDSGWFAPTTYRYNDWKQPRPWGYAGEGGISTHDNNWYAWVNWKSTGHISYKAGVTGFSVTVGNTHLQIESVDSGEGPYTVFLSEGQGYTRVTSADFWLNSITDDHEFGGYLHTASLNDIWKLDTDALKWLDVAMTQQFGKNWRNARLLGAGWGNVYLV